MVSTMPVYDGEDIVNLNISVEMLQASAGLPSIHYYTYCLNSIESSGGFTLVYQSLVTVYFVALSRYNCMILITTISDDKLS